MNVEAPDAVVEPSNPILNPAEADAPEAATPPAEPPKAEEEPPKPEEPPIPKGVQKRIDRAVRQKYEAEARAKALEEELGRIRAQVPQAPARQPADTEPTIDQFDNLDAFVAAKAKWIAQSQIEHTLTEREKREAAERAAAEHQKTVESWVRRSAEVASEIPDFEEVVGASDLLVTPAMHSAIMESELGPKVAYHLATHPEEAESIARMSPAGTLRAIGRLEERLASAKPAVKTTEAPPPLKPVGNRATVTKDPGKMSDAEYEKWRRTGRAA